MDYFSCDSAGVQLDFMHSPPNSVSPKLLGGLLTQCQLYVAQHMRNLVQILWKQVPGDFGKRIAALELGLRHIKELETIQAKDARTHEPPPPPHLRGMGGGDVWGFWHVALVCCSHLQLAVPIGQSPFAALPLDPFPS